jgi:protein-disulfide isomerase
MKRLVVLLLLLLFCAPLWAEKNEDPCALKPPKGADVALVEYEDLQCPDCARAAPLLKEAARTYNIPLVRRDFPLPKHDWARQAAVYGRFFDKKSKKAGEQFRQDIYDSQPHITAANLRNFVERFADKNNVALPMAVDPQGKLDKLVAADIACGVRNNVQHTPTIDVVGHQETGTPVVEVVNRRDLFRMIDDMQRQAAAARPQGTPKKSSKTSAKPSGGF